MTALCFIDFINRVGASLAFNLFWNKLNKFNNTGAQMLYSIYNMTFKLFWNHILGIKTFGFCHMRDVKSVIS